MPTKLSCEAVRERYAKNRVAPVTAYAGAFEPITVECLDCQHVWETSGQTPFRSGCPKCALKRKSAARGYQPTSSQEGVEEKLRRKGLTLVGAYNGVWRPVRVRCLQCGVEKNYSLANNALNTPHGCAACSNRSRGLGSREIEAKVRHVGATLVKPYSGNTHKRVYLRCLTCNHNWSPYLSAVSQGYGCPKCGRTKGWKVEAEIRQLLEALTGWSFPKARPAWLKGRRRYPLELDGYNPEHAVAFEYQGEQHYRPIFGMAVLDKVKINDERKRQLCRYHGVLLIRIPFWKRHNLEGFLRKKLGKRGHS